MAEHTLAWLGLTVLAALCLPVRAARVLILEATGWSLRVALLALLAGAAYMVARPGKVAPEVTDAVTRIPPLARMLPAPGEPTFGPALIAVVVVALLPVLAVLDVCRKYAGRPATAPADPPADARLPLAEELPAEPAHRPTDRRAAADALASSAGRH